MEKKGSFELTIEQKKSRFELDGHKDSRGKTVKEKYKSIRDFKKYVIDPAHDELRKLFNSGNCDICFEYEDIQYKSKPGRPTTTGLNFRSSQNLGKRMFLPSLNSNSKNSICSPQTSQE